MANLNNWLLRGIELGLIKWVLLKEHENDFHMYHSLNAC